MSDASEIRAHVVRKYIDPARRAQLASVSFASDEIHKDLKYVRRYPAVCSAMTPPYLKKKIGSNAPGERAETGRHGSLDILTLIWRGDIS